MSTHRGPCPQCDRGPRDTALAVTTDELGTVAFCHRCGYIELAAAERHKVHYAATCTTAKAEKLEWSTRAESIWRRAQSLRATIGETYLHFRGCVHDQFAIGAMKLAQRHLRMASAIASKQRDIECED